MQMESSLKKRDLCDALIGPLKQLK